MENQVVKHPAIVVVPFNDTGYPHRQPAGDEALIPVLQVLAGKGIRNKHTHLSIESPVC